MNTKLTRILNVFHHSHIILKSLSVLITIVMMLAIASLFERITNIKAEYRERLDKLESNINVFTDIIDGKIRLIDAKTTDIDNTIRELRALENGRMIADRYSRLLVSMMTLDQKISRGESDVKTDIVRVMIFASANVETAKATELLRGITTIHNRQYFIDNFGKLIRAARSEYFYSKKGVGNKILGFINQYIGYVVMDDDSSHISQILSDAEKHIKSGDLKALNEDLSKIQNKNQAIDIYQSALLNYVLYQDATDKIYDIISAVLVHA